MTTSFHMRLLRLGATVVSCAVGAAQTTVLQDVSSAGVAGNSTGSTFCSISDDGRFVAFATTSSNLVPGDDNDGYDVFVHDNVSGATLLVSRALDGTPADEGGNYPSISANGRFVVFSSTSTDLMALPHPPGQVYRLDRDSDGDGIFDQPGTTTIELVSRASNGQPADSISSTYIGAVSADGRVVAFSSGATNLFPGDSNGVWDCFVRYVDTGVTVRTSTSSSGVLSNGTSFQTTISRDGAVAAFTSVAGNLVPSDTNATYDVFVHVLATGVVERVSLSVFGTQAHDMCIAPSLSGDGSLVAFVSSSTDLVPGDVTITLDTFLKNRITGAIERVNLRPNGTATDGGASWPSVSADGSLVAFQSFASDLVLGDTNDQFDVFVRNRTLAQTTLVSYALDGTQGDGQSYGPSLTADGQRLAFLSAASNLTPDAVGQGVDRTFLRVLSGSAPVNTYCTSKTASIGCVPSIGGAGSMSASLSAGFVVHAVDALNDKSGLAFYSFSAPTATPFGGGWMCMQAPRYRTPVRNSGGSAPPANDCSGVFSIDLNLFAAGLDGGNPRPELRVPGSMARVQWWGRDPGYAPPQNVLLSNALELTVGP